MSKLISVIMGIYNCGNTLAEALDSIIAQTYENWEIIMCDDGSSDNTLEVAENYVNRFPDKIHLLKNEKNMGLNFTLNKCLKEAKGFYIARMDGDDISYPERFSEELKLFEVNPEISIVSSPMELFDEEGVWGRTSVKVSPQKRDFVKSTQFCHAACMVKKEAYDAVGGYSVDKKLLRVEDYHLWIKMYQKGYIGMNIEKPLYKMRDDRNAQARRKFRYRLNEAYVKHYAIKHFGLPIQNYIYCLKPIILGLTPSFIYKILHRRKNSGEN